jgi:hypothetical protein
MRERSRLPALIARERRSRCSCETPRSRSCLNERSKCFAASSLLLSGSADGCISLRPRAARDNGYYVAKVLDVTGAHPQAVFSSDFFSD